MDRPKIGSDSAASWAINRDRRSVALDLKQPTWVEALLTLGRDWVTAPDYVERAGVLDITTDEQGAPLVSRRPDR